MNEYWMQLDLMKMLNIDLDIGSFQNYHRMYPLENMIFRLCSIRDNQGKNAVQLFMNTLETISRRDKEQMETVIIDMFKYNKVIIFMFDILSNHFDTLWKEFITTLEPQRIATNKRILDAFHENLKWQISAMDNDNNTLKELDGLITTFESKNSSAQPLPKSKLMKSKKEESCKICNKTIKDGTFRSKLVHVHHCKFCGLIVCENCSSRRRQNHRICNYCFKEQATQGIVDTVNIRLALLRNEDMIKYINDDQIKTNIQYILKIALRGGIEENIASGLITFMVKLFMMKKCTNIALSVFNPFIIQDIMFNTCFRAAIKRSLAQKVNLPDKISMFLQCPRFYELNNVHTYFIDLLVITHKNEIQSWNPHQIQNIQTLIHKFTQKSDKTGIKLWNDILNKLIHPPKQEQYHVPFSKTQDDNKYDDMESEDELGIGAVQPLVDDWEITPSGINNNKGDSSFTMELEYCLSMTQWISFALKMKRVSAFKSLVQYIQNHLRILNKYITTERHINIKSLEFLKSQQMQIVQLSKDCGYGKRFDHQRLDAMIRTFNILIKFKLYLIRFLGRFTIPNEDAIHIETHDFVEYLKHWDLKQYSQVKARPEWNRWMHSNSAKFVFLFEIQSSNVFYSIWCAQRRKMGNIAWNFQNYLNKLYPQVRHQWDDLVLRAMQYRLTFNDISWFKDLNSKQELNIMQLPQNKIKDTQRDITQSLRIDKYVEFVENLTKMVNIFIVKGNTRIKKRDEEDKSWIKLKKNLKIAKRKKNDKTVNIADIARLYRDIKGLVNAEYSNLHKRWINTIVICKQTVHKMANDDHFQRESLQATLELLDDAKDGEITQLSGSLRSVHSLFLSIWQKQHNTKTDLMRFIAEMELKPNDVNNLRQVHDALPRIDRIVADVSKNAQARDMEKLDDAISNGYFKFDQQNIVQREIKQSNQIEIAEIAKKCLYLDKYNVPEIQGMIDIVLLCRSGYHDIDDDDDERKDDQVQGNVKEYIQKVDICKEISELRVQFILVGGRIEGNKLEKIRASLPLNIFYGIQNQWKKRVLNWKEHVLKLRNESHLFNYYTINNIRLIMNELNKCKRSDNGSRFQELLAQFRFARPELTASQLRKIIKSWKVVNANSDAALMAFNQSFNNKVIMNVYDHDEEKKKKNYDLTNARPNLLIVKQRSEAIFATLNSYFTSNVISTSFTNSLSPHQVLLCTKLTTSEDIFIFIFRCLQNEKRFKCNGTNTAPLYCLLFPEDLSHPVLDETINLFNYYLLSKNVAVIHYSLLVISCDANNTLCHILSAYRTNIPSTLSTNICSNLFNGVNDKDIMKKDKPFIQLYQSLAVGLGKSFVIKQKAKQIQGNETDLVRIPFNSSKIDLDFVVQRLYKAYDGRKRRKIIYHIDISSSATNTVNDVLFCLLFLKFIKTSKNRCFSVTNNMAFFVEEPTDLASLKTQQQYNKYKKNRPQAPVEEEFYILHSPMSYGKHKIDIQTNIFQLNDDCHYAAKFLDHFYNGDFETQDPDPLNERTNRVNQLSKQGHNAMMKQYFPTVPYASPIRQKAFWEYLYTQCIQVVHSTVLRNEWHRDNNQYFNKWKQLATESIIDLAGDFSFKKLYKEQYQHGNDEKKYDEADGTEHFHLTQKWQRRSKPIILLNQSIDGSISFLVNDVNKIDSELKQALDYQRFDVLGWNQQNQNNTKQKKIELLLKILGTSNIYGLFDELLSMKPYCDYALTYDNMIKMIGIFFRVKANIPCILMGETGCGKTCLLNYLAKAANIEIERADVHGGFTAQHIRQKMSLWIKRAKQKLSVSQTELKLKLREQTGNMKQSTEKQIIIQQLTKQHEMQKMDYLWVFFDEINTSPDIGYFKEIVCDGYFDGEPLPSNMKVIAACNPYRRRKVDHLSEKSILNDPLAQYVYRVYPLPSTLKEYVWMFGSLSANDEAAYAYQMCQTWTSQLLRKDSNIQRLSNCIVASQGFVRKTLRDSAMVSLRDLARSLKMFVWIYERNGTFDEALIMAIALVYYFRLNDSQRELFSKEISQHIKKFDKLLVGKNGIMDKFVSKLKNSIPKGIALNRSLKENLFLLFICIQTKTPVLLVGKPGSSKTLAMSVIRDYLSDHNRQVLKKEKLLPIHVVSFQCSAQSKAEGIQQRWAQTQKFAQDNKRNDIIYVLLLDEIGLAEHSPYRPLKILHQLLEMNPLPISFIGLSNWSLDASKMNRAICHLCPTHSMKDLVQTGIAMAQQYADNAHDVDKLKPKISLLSNIYSDVMDYSNCIQPRFDFFGSRDFYSVVRHFLTAKNKQNKVDDLNKELIMYFLRNFGGITYERVDGTFAIQKEKGTSLYGLLCKHMGLNAELIKDTINEYSPSQLIYINLNDKRSTHETADMTSSDNFMISRHILAITEYYNSWNILLDLNIINYNHIFIFGSEFQRDKSNIYLYLNKIKNCMETGKTLVLLNLEEIHESLYDMLNQRYTYNKTSNKMYCRIALGSNSERCFVDPSFKCIVISTKREAHKKGGVPIAFLNRFEKQLISYYSSLTPKHNALLDKLYERILDIYCIRNINDIKRIFPGFCKDTFASLILSKTSIVNNEDTIVHSCLDILKDVALTEALIQSAITNNQNYKDNVYTIKYLPTLPSIMQQNSTTKLLIILTFDFASKLEHHSAFLAANTIIKRMSEFSKADAFTLFINRYLKGNDSKGLLLQYRHEYRGMNHFIHIKHIIETAFNKYGKNKANKNIAILVHLRRTKSSNTFPLILSHGSKTVFLDSISQAKPIELKSLATQTIRDICKDRGTELLTATFQRALSHLQFTKEINVEHEINKLSEIFEDENNPLQKCIMNRLMTLLSDDKINRNLGELVGEVVQSNNRWSRGSFYEQLYDIIDRICVVAMMRVLQILYENNNIGTIHNGKHKEIQRLFIELYSNFDVIEVDPIRQSIQNIIENRPNKLYVKYYYSARFPFSKTIHDWCNSQKPKLNLNSSVVDSAQTLKREMNASMPSVLNELSMEMIQLYTNDLICLESHQLQIDRTWPSQLFKLITQYLILITLECCEISGNNERISIAELETALFHKHGLLLHLIKISSILPLEIVREIQNIVQLLQYQISPLMKVFDALLRKLVYSLDGALYQLYNANAIDNSIHYIIENLQNMNDDMKSDDNETELTAMFGILKVKMIALKNNLIISDMDELFDIYGTNGSLCNYSIFSRVLTLLIQSIPNSGDISKDTLGNIILCDLLTSIDAVTMNRCDTLLDYAQFLIDLLCNNSKIINIKWSEDTEYEIVKQLFHVLSHGSIDTNKIINDIQQERSELAGVIIQSINYKHGNQRKKKRPKAIKFARSQKDFNKKLKIRAPLIKQLNPEIYDEAMSSITIHSFFEFFRCDDNYPLLTKLKKQNDEFWLLSNVPDIAQWIQLMHSKYMGTLSETSCREFKMEDVFKQCQLHKWGDPIQWKQQFANYKVSMNTMSSKINLAPPDRGNVNIPIACSLMAKDVHNCDIKNTVECIRHMIQINNEFIQDGTQIRNVSFFDLRKHQLIGTEYILDIIRSNAKSWICYDAKNKAAPESYIIFDLERIENEIRDKCIFGRYKLRIKYQNFDFVGSKNMLRLIQQIKIAQQTLNYEIWHVFDSQFESNLQRKRALTVIEDVIALLCSSTGNKQTDDTEFYDDDDDEDKEDEKDDGTANFMSKFIHKVGGKMRKYDKNEELWHFMKHKLKISNNICNLFELHQDPNSNVQKKIQIKHIQNIWNELVKRIEGEMTQYEDQCLICFMSITAGTPIKLECCGVSLHYDCLKQYIESGFGNNGDRITLKQLSCLLCRNPMKHKAANDLFKETQILYDKVTAVALKQLRYDNKINDAQITNPNGEYYNNPAAYAMKLFAFFLCYQCKAPYFFGTNRCGDEEAENNMNKEDRLCRKCDKHNNKKWLQGNTKQCPKCHKHIEKNGGCNHMTCRRPGGCGHEFCWLCLANWYGHNNCVRR